MQKDIWDILGVVGSLASGILIPLTIAVVGLLFRRQQERSQLEERKADRLAVMLKHLGSDSDRERLMAVKVSEHLAAEGHLPPELVTALSALAITEGAIGAAASEVLKNLPSSDRERKEAQFVKDVLPRLIDRMSVGADALGDYLRGSHTLGVVERMAEANRAARDMLVSRSELLPHELRSHASRLIAHYDDWLAGYNSALSALPPNPQSTDTLEYIAAPNYPFPRVSAQAFLDYSKEGDEASSGSG